MSPVPTMCRPCSSVSCAPGVGRTLDGLVLVRLLLERDDGGHLEAVAGGQQVGLDLLEVLAGELERGVVDDLLPASCRSRRSARRRAPGWPCGRPRRSASRTPAPTCRDMAPFPAHLLCRSSLLLLCRVTFTHGMSAHSRACTRRSSSAAACCPGSRTTAGTPLRTTARAPSAVPSTAPDTADAPRRRSVSASTSTARLGVEGCSGRVEVEHVGRLVEHLDRAQLARPGDHGLQARHVARCAPARSAASPA